MADGAPTFEVAFNGVAAITKFHSGTCVSYATWSDPTGVN